MVIMLDHCFMEREGKCSTLLDLIILVVPAQIFLFGAGFIWIKDSATEKL